MPGLTQAMCTSFKAELMTATHNFTTGTGNTFKIALFKANASITGTYSAATANYSTMTGNSDELAASGNYSTGGNTLTNVTPTTSGTTGYTDFADSTWSAATFTSRGALIYNSSASNKTVCVLDFGADKTATAGDFTIQFPTADASNAILRIA
jgi:hypothetical protein